MSDIPENQDTAQTRPSQETGGQTDSSRPSLKERFFSSGKGRSVNEEGWERDTMERLLFATLKEQRARRRWGIFFKLASLVIFVMLVSQLFGLGEGVESTGRHTALIEIDGAIQPDGKSAAEPVIAALNKAFADKGSVGVVLRANSPGGTPVQAGMINDEIVRLRQEYPHKPLYVVVEEMCASGCYYVAAAADRIYVNKASVVGSIGVLINGFGFNGLMDKLGVERRLLTAGENKGFLDPFSPQSASQNAYARQLLNEIHQQFIEAVRKGRGDRLVENKDTFSGLFWTGASAIELGLADDFGTVDSVARDVLEAEDIVDYTQHERLSDRVLKQFGASIGTGMLQSISKQMGPVLR